jgi:hypothetical protein
LKVKTTVAIAGLAALAIGSTTATAGNGDKVTGGGQILIGANAGNTIAFTAQGTTSEAKGRVTFIDRSAGKGQLQEKFKGIVDCVETGAMGEGGFGVVSGYERGDENNRFLLRVLDNGQGAAAENDMIEFDQGITEDTCKDDELDDEAPGLELGRGNAKVRDGANDTNDPEPAEENNTSASALSALGL